ncbi:Plasma membrane t-SNARE, secretory vesicle fusion [Gryganskiella cystojenkinii]|nr:Plasma membrane t-SNARE, secretory vesicle fusion [Gryganskiella cystojenkinii]
MSRDRLNDFNNGSSQNSSYPYLAPNNNNQNFNYSNPYTNAPPSDNQKPVEMAPLRGDTLSQFFQETEVISSKIQQFQSNINEVDQLFTRSLNARNDTEGAKQLEETTPLTESNRNVRTKEEYDRRKLRTSTLSKQFKDALTRFQNVQVQNGQKSKETVARQYRIANPAATEDDIRRLVDEDQSGAFSQQLMQQSRGQQAFAAVQNRQRELHSLQESIVELSQLFKQLEVLVSDQQMQFEEIEQSVNNAERDIEKGDGEVGLALKHGISARKMKWIGLGIVVLIIIIILIIGAAQGWFTKKT